MHRLDTQPDGDFLDYTYDAAHRTADTTSDAAAVITRQLTRVYDQLGRLEPRTVPE